MHPSCNPLVPRQRAADVMIISIIIINEAKEQIKEPEIRSQKLLNFWQIANHLALALAFPLCAKVAMTAAAEAQQWEVRALPLHGWD